MSRNETQTCRELIEPALREAGWSDAGGSWDTQVRIGPGPVNLTGEAMYDPSQRIVADYLLKLSSSMSFVPARGYFRSGFGTSCDNGP